MGNFFSVPNKKILISYSGRFVLCRKKHFWFPPWNLLEKITTYSNYSAVQLKTYFCVNNLKNEWATILCDDGYYKRIHKLPWSSCCNNKANRPTDRRVLSCQAFDLEWGWRWPCCDRDQCLVSMITERFTFEKQQGLYHKKVTLSLTPVQRLGIQARNCKHSWLFDTVKS